MMASPDSYAIELILKAVKEPYTVVHSDAHPMYKSIQWENMRMAQLIHIHKGSRDLFHSNLIEGVWWVLKKQIRKMYSQIQSKGIENFIFKAWYRRERDRRPTYETRTAYVEDVIKLMFKNFRTLLV